MSIRITGGKLRGRLLREAVGPNVRPTSSRVREALFSIVGQDLSGLRFLDAFGGAGVVAIEAASRGAEVTVVERDRRNAAAIRRAAASVGAALEVRVGDTLAVAATLGRFDLVFADPPYAVDPGAVLGGLLVTSPDVLVFEADAKAELPERVGELVVDRPRVYGGTTLWVYRRPEAG